MLTVWFGPVLAISKCSRKWQKFISNLAVFSKVLHVALVEYPLEDLSQRACALGMDISVLSFTMQKK